MGLHRSFRHVEGARDFLERHVFIVEQGDHRLLRLAQSLRELFPSCPSRRCRSVREAVARGGHRDRRRRDGIVLQRRFATSSRPECRGSVERPSPDDPVEPRAERSVAAEIGERAPRPDERVLGHFFRVRLRPDDPEGESVRPVAVPFDEQRVSARIALTAAGDELFLVPCRRRGRGRRRTGFLHRLLWTGRGRGRVSRR